MGLVHLTTNDIGVVIQKGSTNTVVINSSSDLPAPSGGKHDLQPNTTYLIRANLLSLGSNYLNCTGTTIIRGNSATTNVLSYSGTGSAIRGIDVNFSLSNLLISATTGSAFAFSNDSKDKNFVVQDFICASGSSIGTINGFENVLFNICNYQGLASGLIFNNNKNLYLINQSFSDTVLGNQIFLNSGSYDNVIIDGGIHKISIGNVGININIGSITINNSIAIKNNVFQGTGTYTSGYTVSDLRVTQLNNFGIIDFKALGSFSWSENLSSFTISGSGAWNKIIGGTSVSGSLQRFIHTSPNRLTYIGIESKRFKVTVSLAVDYQSGSAFIASIGVSKNGALPSLDTQNGLSVYSSDEPCSTSCEILLSTNDYIEVFIKKFAAGSQLVKVGFINVIVTEL